MKYDVLHIWTYGEFLKVTQNINWLRRDALVVRVLKSSLNHLRAESIELPTT